MKLKSLKVQTKTAKPEYSPIKQEVKNNLGPKSQDEPLPTTLPSKKPKVTLPEEEPTSNTNDPIASREKRHLTSTSESGGCKCVIS